MAKPWYKIPTAINRSKLDHEITLSAWDVSSKPLPLKVILYWVAAFVVGLWLLTKSPISNLPIWALVFFVIWYFGLAAYLGTRTKTNEMKFMQIPPLIEYMTKGARQVTTRRNSNPWGLMKLTGIRDIDEDGTIWFLDGSVGMAYSVVGSASRLLFASDQARILARVDNFWRKVDTNCDWIFLTTREPQRVTRQIANLERQNLALRGSNRDPELVGLMQEKLDRLTKEVGGRYASIHHHLIIKAPSLDPHLRDAHRLLQSEVENSSHMIKQCVLLDRDATVKVLRNFYSTDDMMEAELK